MDNTQDDVFTRLNAAIEDWNSQRTDAHRELAGQLSSAKAHLTRLLDPAQGLPAAPPTPAPDGESVSAAERVALTAQIAELSAERATLMDSLAERDAELRKRDGLIASLEMEVAALREAAGDPGEAAQLREDLDQLAAEAAAHANRAAEFEAEATNATAQAQALEDQLADLQSQNAALTDELAAATAALAQAPEATEAMATEDDGLLAETRAALERAEAEVESLRAAQEAATLQAEALAAMSDEVRMLQEELDAARASLAGDALGGPDLEALRDEQAALSAECARLHGALEDAEAECARWRAAAEAHARADDDAPSTLEDDVLETAPSPLPPLDVAPAPPAPAAPAIEAFDAQGHKKRIGEILVDQGFLTREQLQGILGEQARDPQRRLGVLVVERGYTGEDVVARVLAAQLRLHYVDLALEEIDPKAPPMISAHLARLHNAVPIREAGGKLTVAMANPLDLIAIEDIELASKCHVDPVVSTLSAIRAAHERHYIPGL